MQAVEFKRPVPAADYRRESSEPWNHGSPAASGLYDVQLAFKSGSQPAYFYAPTGGWYVGYTPSGDPSEIHRLNSVIGWKAAR